MNLSLQIENPIEEVRNYIKQTFLFGTSDNPLESDDSLLEKGILNSTGVLDLVSFLEERFEISLADDEIIPENLDSLQAIASFLRRKMELCEATVLNT